MQVAIYVRVSTLRQQKAQTIEQQLDALIVDEDIENELHNIKSSLSKDSQQTTQA